MDKKSVGFELEICGWIWWLMLVMLYGSLCYGTVTDFYCLKEVKDSIRDPLNSLYTWNFTNTTEGSICNFLGVECWHPGESKVLNLKLSGMGLEGHFPVGIKNCSSLTGLDLSDNNFSGALPSNMAELIPYITSLGLSSNFFSGPIPASLSNCTFLNVLNLEDNEFSGQIPQDLAGLSRLKTFNVANNNLSGPVPFFSNVSVNYTDNPGLCGGSLANKCKAPKKNIQIGVVGAAVGAVVLVVIVSVGLSFYFTRVAVAKKKQDDIEGNRWAKSLKATKAFKASLFSSSKFPVSMFENTVSKMNLKDLMKATNSFSNSNIIGSASTGTMYKAILPDGTLLVVQRLQASPRSEKEFLFEMNTLGSVKHKNLVPLLGHCIAKKERFLVYKYMANGNLFDQLHPSDPEAKLMEWPLRLKM
ncbi:putative inactive leucine-rich repeat receptor-like protein [Drosera capensis]